MVGISCVSWTLRCCTNVIFQDLEYIVFQTYLYMQSQPLRDVHRPFPYRYNSRLVLRVRTVIRDTEMYNVPSLSSFCLFLFACFVTLISCELFFAKAAFFFVLDFADGRFAGHALLVLNRITRTMNCTYGYFVLVLALSC